MKEMSIDKWKSHIRKLSKEKNISIVEIQQRFILEEFVKKISCSEYKNSFIIKGGFVVSTLLGIDTRSTRDIDMTFNPTIFNENEIVSILNKVMEVDNDSFFDYKISNIKNTQLDDGYSGFNVTLDAVHDKLKLRLKLDISNNTLIYPYAVHANLPSMINDQNINVMSYPLENIIAEKFETTLDRGEFNTRMRDLFDIQFLMSDCKHLINDELLVETIIEVSRDRGTIDNLFNFERIIQELRTSEIFNQNFEKYQKKTYPYHTISLDDIFETFILIHEQVEIEMEREEKEDDLEME